VVVSTKLIHELPNASHDFYRFEYVDNIVQTATRNTQSFCDVVEHEELGRTVGLKVSKLMLEAFTKES